MNVFPGGVDESSVEVACMHVERVFDGLRFEKRFVRLLRPFFLLTWRTESIAEVPEEHAPTVQRPHRLFR